MAAIWCATAPGRVFARPYVLPVLAVAALGARPGRTVIVTDRDNFPTDRYLLESIASRAGAEIRWIQGDPVAGPSVADVVAALDERVAFVTLSHVAYRSGALADMRGRLERWMRKTDDPLLSGRIDPWPGQVSNPSDGESPQPEPGPAEPILATAAQQGKE